MRPHARFVIGLFAIAFGCFVFVSVPHAFAQIQSQALQDFAASSKLPSTPFPIIIAQIIRAVLGVMGILLTILVIYAGFLYMKAGGDPKKTDQAKSYLKNAIIGLVIALSAFTITQFILSRLQAAVGFGGITSSSTLDRYKEPLAGALNGKVIQDHYPFRDALDVPRNAKIMITFIDPIDPASIIQGYTGDSKSTGLNRNHVLIFQTALTANTALASDKVQVSMSDDRRTFVFKPAALLGNDLKDTNYTVQLKPGITSNGKNIFGNAPGYSWTFQVSTKMDLTPPKIVSVVPVDGTEQDRNVTVELIFSEAMDPTTVSGTFATNRAQATFSHIQVSSQAIGKASDPLTRLNGAFEISNGYRTVDFTTDEPCAKDACGNVVYCLPPTASIHVLARAATLDTTAIPQSLVINGGLDGLADAAGNSFDGNGDGKAEGKGKDDYAWAFTTSRVLDERTPKVAHVTPAIRESLLGPDASVGFMFTMPMKASTLTNANVQVWPDPFYAMWFSTNVAQVNAKGDPIVSEEKADASRVEVVHPAFIRTEQGGHDYYPVVTNDVRGINQFCFFPAIGPSYTPGTGNTEESCAASAAAPYCCNGAPQDMPCVAPKSKTDLPDTSS